MTTPVVLKTSWRKPIDCCFSALSTLLSPVAAPPDGETPPVAPAARASASRIRNDVGVSVPREAHALAGARIEPNSKAPPLLRADAEKPVFPVYAGRPGRLAAASDQAD